MLYQSAVNTFLLAFPALLSILNPAGSAFVFLAITGAVTPAERSWLAGRVASYCAALLFASFFVGSYVLEFFGVSLPVMRVAGGIVIASTAWQMLNAPNDSDTDAPRPVHPTQLRQQAFYPLTMPLTAGPGTISVAIALGTSRPSSAGAFLAFSLGVSAATLASCALIYFAYRHADRLSHLIGSTGTSIVMRLSAFLLFCIGFQVGWTGLAELLRSLPR